MERLKPRLRIRRRRLQMSSKKPSFEESLKKLEEASEKIRSDEASLEDAIKSYRSGIEAYKQCKSILDDAVSEIETITKEVE